ncbi:MAG TPA: tRNA (adenosine(37)-N6)-dimethylallyltransferase MiaA [Candidatus Paceibacterota bacterium]|nr:tRNA (adenosine(37)-N6)-dimethylallyltransferase MiaA [Candidatus Paceibacterota bacterium]
MQKQPVIAIVGPTASGKSSLGIYLAQKLGGEVISADSRQVYKGLNIGTGKVTKKEMAGIPHHLLDVASPKRQFTVDQFVKLGTKAIKDILQRGHTPIIVGGTGLYVDMLLGRMSYPEVPPNPALRKRLEKKSTEHLFVMLEKLDPARARTIDAKNPRRLVRAVEIAKALGKNSFPTAEQKYDVFWLGLNPDDATLKKNIHMRLTARMKTGMVAEARRLHAHGLSYKRMRELGLEYRFLADYLETKLDKEEFEESLERAIWQYAKRQRTWFKRNMDIHWIQSKTEALQLVKHFAGGRRDRKIEIVTTANEASRAASHRRSWMPPMKSEQSRSSRASWNSVRSERRRS